MKKVLSLIISLSIIMSVISFADFSAFALASSGTCGANITWTLNSSGTLTLSGSGQTYDYCQYGIIEEGYDNSPFAANKSIKKIVVNNGITGIGRCIFDNCSELTDLTISSSVTRIGEMAFECCTKLNDIDIPDSVTSIGEMAFYNSSYYNNPSNWEKGSLYTGGLYLDGCLLSYGEIENVGVYSVLKGTRIIADHVFYRHYELTGVKIPYGVKYIGEEVFGWCHNMKYAVISDSVVNLTNCCLFVGATLYCHKGSAAYNYAQNNGIKTNTAHNGTVLSYEKATLTKDGQKTVNCEICGKTAKDVFHHPNILKLSKTVYTYDGSVKKPSVTVFDANGNTIASSNYTVSYSSGRKNPGIYDANVTFKGNYSGTKKLSFKIKPAKAEITKAVPMSRAFGIKWKKVTGISGYKIQVSTSKDFSYDVKTHTAKASSKSADFSKGIKGNTKYYIRIKAYKKVTHNGKTENVPGSWSKVKSVTTKG